MVSIMSELALILTTVIWGLTFSITKEGVRYLDPLLYLAIRFGLAYLLLRPIHFFIDRRRYTKEELKIGTGAALFLGVGYAAQTYALQYTTASKAAFITGLSVVLVPMLAIIVLKEKPNPLAVLGACIAFLGLATLAVEPGIAGWINWGDLLALGCALSFAGHILYLGEYATKISPLTFSTVQIGVAAIICAILGLLRSPLPNIQAIPIAVWWGLIYMALLATLAATLLQTWAQRHTTPTKAAVIFTLEPVFAALFAYLMLGETLTLKTLGGGALILAGVLLAEVKVASKPVVIEENLHG